MASVKSKAVLTPELKALMVCKKQEAEDRKNYREARLARKSAKWWATCVDRSAKATEWARVLGVLVKNVNNKNRPPPGFTIRSDSSK